MSRGARLLLAGALLAPLVFLVVEGGAVAGADPVVTSSTTRATPGATVVATVTGWPKADVITIQVCGNDALRGSEDCDQVSGQSVQSRMGGPESVLLQVAVPPTPCPCVLRAADTRSRTVVTAPFEIVGNAFGPLVRPSPANAPAPFTVAASIPERSPSFFGRLRRVLGGPSHRDLLLVVHNSSPYPLTDVVVTAALGRHASGGAPLDAPQAFDLAVGQTRRVLLPMKLEAPVHGRYVAAGQVYVGGRSVGFSVRVSSTPWGLIVLGLLVLVAVVVAVAVAIRTRRDGNVPNGTAGEQQVTSDGTVDEQGLLDPSRVGVLS